MAKIYKIYVSSTIVDLTEERRAVLDWLRLARHQAVDSYLPGSNTVRDSCLDDVAACDLYVLILGHRYGFQPPDENPEGLSITQLEFRRAGECGIPRVALLRTSIPDVGLSDLADAQRLALVSAFRDEVARQVRPAQFSELQGLIQGLSTGIQSQLDKLVRRDEGQAPPVTAGRVLRLAPRPVFLAGREELLAELDVQLAGDAQTGPRVVALYGLGGAGKTSLALEYAHRHLGEAGVCWQLPAEDPTVLAAGFGELAAQLGAAGSGDPVAAVHGLLADSPARWLLVFDNAPDRASVAPFVPPAGPGRVLVTSRDQIWPPGHALQVPVLDTEVAAEFLVGRTGDADRQAALGLAGELGGLPLALEQAAAYVEVTGGTLAGYLASFVRRRPEMLRRGKPIGYGLTVATTWTLAFEDLEHAAPGAVGLLRLLAFCASEAIPLRLLLQPRPGLAGRLGDEVAPVLGPLLEDELAAGDAIAALRRYSLISPPADGLVSVHRLVQLVTADQMPAELAEAWQQTAVTLVDSAFPPISSDTALRERCGILLPHALEAIDHAEAAGADPVTTSLLLNKVAMFLWGRADHPQAKRLLERSLALERVRHGDDLSIAAKFNDLGLVLWDMGRLGEARSSHERALEIRKENLGLDHPDVGATLNNLGAVLCDLESWVEAQDALDKSLRIWMASHGSRSPVVALCLSNLGVALRGLGQLERAKAMLEQSLGIWEELSVTGSGSRAGLDAILSGLGHLAGERAYSERDLYLAGAKAASGGEENLDLESVTAARAEALDWAGATIRHVAVATTLDNLGTVLAEMGESGEALRLFFRGLGIREVQLGSKHPDVAWSLNNIAVAIADMGYPAVARVLLDEVLKIREDKLGPDHPDVAASLNNMATIFAGAGDLAGARELFLRSLRIRQEMLGAGHRAVVRTRKRLDKLE